MIGWATRDDAYYWGGGVLAPDVDGRWWSLHARGTPSGPELYSVGLGGRIDGWPKILKEKFVFTGGRICVLQKEESE